MLPAEFRDAVVKDTGAYTLQAEDGKQWPCTITRKQQVRCGGSVAGRRGKRAQSQPVLCCRQQPEAFGSAAGVSYTTLASCETWHCPIAKPHAPAVLALTAPVCVRRFFLPSGLPRPR